MSSKDPYHHQEKEADSRVHDFRSLLIDNGADGSDEFFLGNGSKIAVIGGGPSGSFFAYFTLKMARMMGREVKITIFEPKNFMSKGPAGCNHCGGVVSELMVQSLAVEGINVPTTVVQRGINSYQLVYFKDRWWIVNVLWTGDRNGEPIPRKYLNNK